MDKEKFRKKIREESEREWIKTSFQLRDKKPEETLKAMFDLCNFAEKIHNARKEK
jgi:hypothetical protein